MNLKYGQKSNKNFTSDKTFAENKDNVKIYRPRKVFLYGGPLVCEKNQNTLSRKIQVQIIHARVGLK